MNIILQPCSSNLACANYVKTISNANITLKEIKKYLSKLDYSRLFEIYGNGSVQIWGVKASVSKKWQKSSIGDIVIFTRNKKLFSYGTLCYKIQNSQLAAYLWNKDENGEEWEYIYFLVEMSNLNIPYEDFNNVVGYKENYVIQSFSVLEQEKTDRFLNLYPLQSKTFVEPIEELEYVNIISNSLLKMDTVDEKVLSIQRKEQSFLRRNLFNGKVTASCAICGNTFPVDLLCCSHIKKRCYCTLEEKKDYKNIVIPMCEFGCDKLYEKGYIAVKDGLVKVLKFTGISVVDNKLKTLNNKPVVGYNKHNQKYFDEHYKQNHWKN